MIFLFKFLRYLLFAELVESNDVEIPYVYFLSWILEAHFSSVLHWHNLLDRVFMVVSVHIKPW